MKKGDISFSKKIKSLVVAVAIMAIGLILFKYLPMMIYGANILFDASMHLTIAIFVLYVLWYFVDQNKGWRIPYLIFSLVVVAIVSFQRIIANAHNDIGLLIGLVISLIAIVVSRWDYFNGKFDF